MTNDFDELECELSNDDYHDNPAIGSSGLKEINQSPAHYFARYLDPNREPRKETPAMRLGTAIHCAILEPGEFDNRYCAIPEGLNRRTKEGKALWADIIAEGKIPLPDDQLNTIVATARAALALPVSRVIFSIPGGARERSIFWTDAETGAECKCRPDYMVPPCDLFPNGLIVDVKSAEDASPNGFGRAAWNYEYALSAAFYSDGYRAHFGTAGRPEWLWLAQEKVAPYAAAYYSATPAILAYGRREYRRLLGIYAECKRTGVWPAYGDTVQALTLPAWADKLVQEAVPA